MLKYYETLYSDRRIKLMATVKAFPALRFTYSAGDISKNVCPPYDIISEEERLGYISDSGNNIIRLEKPVGEDAYKKAQELYLSWRKSGILENDEKSGFYVYEEEFEALGKTKKIRGIFARVKLEEFSKGIVLPHEETLSKAKVDRFELMRATRCNFSPVYSMYSDPERKVTSKLDNLGKPEIEFVAKDGVIQRLWKIDDEKTVAEIEKAFETKQLFIADGHHRYETALNFRNHLLEEGVIKSDTENAGYIMMMLIDMENDGLVVFPTHRIVRDLDNFNTEKALEKIKEYFDVCEIDINDAEKVLSDNTDKKVFVMYDGEKSYLLTLVDTQKAQEKLCEMNKGHTKAYTDLDVTVLHSLILENVLGIDKENMANQINLGYTRDIEEAVQTVKSKKANCAFLINPTLVSQIKDAALAGEKMPQKSTYFYPKLITGLVMNELCDYNTLK